MDERTEASGQRGAEPQRPERRGRAAGDERELRGGYLGFVAHEVRNPLSTALWSAELLARMSPEDRAGARGEKLTAMCLRSLARVRQLVEDHFLVERLDADGLPIRIEEVDVREVLEPVVARAGADAPAVDVPEGLTVAADRALLERALDSLVAAAAGGKRAPVRLSARAQDGRVVIRVEGEPPGPGALEDPRKGAPSEQRGRALSVPVARRVAAALGGDLRLEGEGYVLSLPSLAAYTPGTHR